jgi:hypothetical protein
MSRELLLKLLLVFFFLGLIVINYSFHVPLLVYNAKYPFLSRNTLSWFFRLYPFVNGSIILLLFLHQKSARFLALAAIALYLIYYLKLIKDTDCAICMAKGLIPFFNIEVQTLIFALFSVVALLYYLAPAKGRATPPF